MDKPIASITLHDAGAERDTLDDSSFNGSK